MLNLRNNSIVDLTPLSGLTSLVNLNLGFNQIGDLSPLSGLANLNTLDLAVNQISDLSPLSGLANLASLQLGSNQISDLGPLSGLTNLFNLFLASNQISDLSSLNGLTSLLNLDLAFNQISNLSPLSGLTGLDRLILPSNQISDVSPLSGLTGLLYLDLDNNQIADISPLGGLTGLIELDLSVNGIDDVSPLATLSSAPGLRLIWLNQNQLSDITPLAGLTQLRNVSFPTVGFYSPDPSNAPGLRLEENFIDINPGSNQRLVIDDLNSIDGLTVEFQPQGVLNDNFADALTLTGTSGQVTGTNTGATGEPNHAGVSLPLKSAWFLWTAPDDGILTVDTQGSNYDTTLAAYTGGAVDSLQVIESNDDTFSVQSEVSFPVVSGETYAIAVDGFSGSNGTYTLNYAFRVPQTLRVSNLDDAGSGSLRQAIFDALEGDRIEFDVTGTILLTSGRLFIDRDLTISGPGADQLEVSGDQESQVFLIDFDSSVTIEDIAIVDGRSTGSFGGGISNSGDLELNRAVVARNYSPCFGGGIYSVGKLVIEDSAIFDNATGIGGSGGGVYSSSIPGDLRVSNSTISRNRSGFGGGMIIFTRDGSLRNCTMVGNVASIGGGIWTSAPLTMANSIIANNGDGQTGDDVVGPLTSEGFNLIGIADDVEGLVTSDLLGSSSTPLEPLTGVLQDNGGPTPNHALLPGSPALDAGDPAFDGNAFSPPLNTDQRGMGFPRVFNGRLDIGAVESDGSVPSSGPPAIVRQTRSLRVFQSRNLTIEYGDIDFTDPDSPFPGAFTLTVLDGTNYTVLNGSTLTPDPGFSGTLNVSISVNDGVNDSDPFVLAVDVPARSTHMVTSLNDSGAGFLRQAVLDANDGDVIVFAVTGTIVLDSGEISINKVLDIIGPGPDQLTISGDLQSRIFSIFTDSGVRISEMSLVKGVSLFGGAVRNVGDLQLIRLNIIGNQALYGGGVYCVPCSGGLVLRESTVSDNVAILNGGGINVFRGDLTLINSTITGNTSQNSNGGGIHFGSIGILALHQSTVSQNRAIMSEGGGLDVAFSDSTTIENSIIANNQSAGSGPDLNVYGNPVTARYNLIGVGESSGITHGVDGNLVGTVASPLDPVLGSLYDHGGSIPTHALLPGSPALNAGDPGFDPAAFFPSLDFDQRGDGFPRVVNGTVDMGAFEFDGLPLPLVAPIITNHNVLEASRTEGHELAVTDFLIHDPDTPYPDGFSLSVLEGDGYFVDGDAVTPAPVNQPGNLPGFSALLRVGVTVHDGSAPSDVFTAGVVTEPLDSLPSTLELPRIIDFDMTLTADRNWLLADPTFVTARNGATNRPVLEVEPGTVIRGRNSDSRLVISRDGMIKAEGTRENPIVFTSELDDFQDNLTADDAGLWGGIVVLGNAFINSRSDGAVVATPVIDQAPGFGLTGDETAFVDFGGSDDNDNSGILRYVSIRYGGAPVAGTHEVGSLMLGGVGRGTTIDSVEVFASQGDGIDLRGGAVDLTRVAVAFGKDDSFAYHQGWRGVGQFWFSIAKDSGSDNLSDRAGDHAGATSPVDAEPLSDASIANATYIGIGDSLDPDGLPGGANSAFLIRRNASARYFNSIFLDFESMLQIDDDNLERFNDGDAIVFEDNIWFSHVPGNNSPSGLVVVDGAVDTSVFFSDGSRNNQITDPLLWGVSRIPNRRLDPRPRPNSPAASGDGVPAAAPAGVFPFPEIVSYLGAFDPRERDYWIRYWTALEEKGYLGPQPGTFGEFFDQFLVFRSDRIAADEDHSNDGISNFAAFASGLEPELNNSRLVRELVGSPFLDRVLDPDSQNFVDVIKLRFLVSLSAQGLNFRVQHSTDLINFSDAEMVGNVDVVDTTDDFVVAEVQIKLTPGARTEFFRVLVEEQ